MASARQATPSAVPGESPSASGDVQEAAPAPQPPKISALQEAINLRFEGLLRHVQANRPTEDVSLIRKAWEFCVQHHEGQMRASSIRRLGELVEKHPDESLAIIRNWLGQERG